MSRQPGPGEAPISFRTIPGRNRTQKWQQAKTYNYDGDDWGGYDPYDEYGGQEDAPPPPMPSQPSSSQSRARKNSFDQGDERRQFSAGPVLYGERGPGSGGRRPSQDPENIHTRPRDFTSPEHAPAPLKAPGSTSPSRQAPHSAGAGADAGAFPPRKSSISNARPSLDAAPVLASGPTMNKEKELPTPPFVRPSDIYKRMEQEKERERQSSDSGRPSMDSLQREKLIEPPAQQVRPLSSVEEAASSVTPEKSQITDDTSPRLPAIRGFSGFGSDFLPASSAEASASQEKARQTEDSQVPLASAGPTSGHGRAPDELAHQPSQGYRSVVHQAFDQDDRSISRDNSQSTSVGTGFSRSDTNSTAGISPIISRAPSAPTGQKAQEDREASVPTIAEESSSPRSSGLNTIPRKPTIGRSRLSSGDTGTRTVTPGYRRSLDPPSPDNSPARRPALGDASSRRLSSGLSVDTEHVAEAPAVGDQGVETYPTLRPVETPASELSQPSPGPNAGEESQTGRALPKKGRARAGTDYSLREADMAADINSSSDQPAFSPTAAEIERKNQNLFLEQHAPENAQESAADRAAWSTAPPHTASGRNSPTKGRVREIAGKYQDIENVSRRNSGASVGSSKSSWSNFRGSEENLSRHPLKRKGTGNSGLVVEKRSDGEDAVEERSSGGEADQTLKPRPAVPTHEPSFRPNLPGGWVSYAGTPGATPGPVTEPARGTQSTEAADAARDGRVDDEEEDIDFSPTKPTHSLQERPVSGSPPKANLFTQMKTAAEAIAGDLVQKGGLSHQTRDFASNEPAAPVDKPETRAKPPSGEIGYWQSPARPEAHRNETGTSSVATSEDEAPPTLPSKDNHTPQNLLVSDTNADRPMSNYFSGAVPPLRPGSSSRNASVGPEFERRDMRRQVTDMSLAPGADDTESDRLRKEIVRSLDAQNAEQRGNKEEEEETVQRAQDALQAPENAERVGRSESALPGAEVGAGGAPAKEAQTSPRLMLDQRFSWENRAAAPPGEQQLQRRFSWEQQEDATPTPQQTGIDKSRNPEIREPKKEADIEPEMPYERPRSRQLHIMNRDGGSDSEEEVDPPRPGGTGLVVGGLAAGTGATPAAAAAGGRDESANASLRELPPSPVASEAETDSLARRLPSYYRTDTLDSSADNNDAATTAATPTSPQIPVPTSPTLQQQQSQQPRALAAAPAAPTTTAKKIPPFREILSIKSAPQRIRTYDDTRQSFADMHTGLSDWVADMLERHSEYAELHRKGGFNVPADEGTHTGGGTSGEFTGLKLPGAGGGGRGGAGGLLAAKPSTGAYAGEGGHGGGGVDMDRVQQRGKDIMKSAGVLGGKAQAGAKGLFARGKSRFGSRREGGSGAGAGGPGVRSGEKAPPPIPTVPTVPEDATSRPSTTATTITPASIPAPAPADYSSIPIPPIPATPSSSSHSPSPAISISDDSRKRQARHLRRSSSPTNSSPRTRSRSPFTGWRRRSSGVIAGVLERPKSWIGGAAKGRKVGDAGGVAEGSGSGTDRAERELIAGGEMVTEGEGIATVGRDLSEEKKEGDVVGAGGVGEEKRARDTSGVEASKNPERLNEVLGGEKLKDKEDPEKTLVTHPAFGGDPGLEPSVPPPTQGAKEDTEKVSRDLAPPTRLAALVIYKPYDQTRRNVEDTKSKPGIATPVTAIKDDLEKRSTVSAEDRSEGLSDAARGQREVVSSSRRSSVSSLGRDSHDRRQQSESVATPSEYNGPHPSEYTQMNPYEPSGPAASAVAEGSSLNRTQMPADRVVTHKYGRSGSKSPCPLSYVPATSDFAGEPAPEDGNVAVRTPTGMPVASQSVDQPAQDSFLQSATTSTPVAVPAGAPSHRRSVFPRPEKPTNQGNDPRAPNVPATAAITDDFGLEGLHSDPASIEVSPSLHKTEQLRRKSGFFNALRSSSSASRRQTHSPVTGREASASAVPPLPGTVHAAAAANDARDATLAKPTTLKKPLRASTGGMMLPTSSSTSPPAPARQKSQRFPTLSTLFGRSNTPAANAVKEKPKKLTKTQTFPPPQAMPPARQNNMPPAGQQWRGPPPLPQHHAAKGYAEYEAQRRREIPDLGAGWRQQAGPPPQQYYPQYSQQSPPSQGGPGAPGPSPWPSTPPGQPIDPRSIPPEDVGGWYPPAHPSRRVYSEGMAQGSQYPHTPEHFRRAEGAYDGGSFPFGRKPQLPRLNDPTMADSRMHERAVSNPLSPQPVPPQQGGSMPQGASSMTAYNHPALRQQQQPQRPNSRPTSAESFTQPPYRRTSPQPYQLPDPIQEIPANTASFPPPRMFTQSPPSTTHSGLVTSGDATGPPARARYYAGEVGEERGKAEGPGAQREGSGDDPRMIMRGASYPGMEWAPR